MSEVPEHLLRRSRERRAALGLDGGEGEEASAPAAAAPSSAPAVAAETAPEPAGGGGVAVVEEASPEPVPTTPPPPPRRPGVPLFALVLLVALPVYAFVYLGAFGNRSKANAADPVALGGSLFAANCAVCHGASGEGGVGPKLAAGEVLKTWPNVADHVNWVHTGGAPFVGKTYGGQGHSVPANNVMPAFGQDHGGSLTNDQIVDIVCYERIGLSGAPNNPQNCPASGAAPGS